MIMESSSSLPPRVRFVLMHLGYLLLFTPFFLVLATVFSASADDSAVQLVAIFVGANVFSLFLQRWLKSEENKIPTSPLSLLVHNASFFTQKLLNLAALAWTAYLVLTVGFALFMYQFLFLCLFVAWFFGTALVLVYTARTKKVYAQSGSLPTAQAERTFWPYILVFIFVGLALLLSLPGVRGMLKYQYAAQVTGAVPGGSVSATYISADTSNCDFYKGEPYGNRYEFCKLEKYDTEQIYTSEPLDCSDMGEYADHCNRLHMIQTAIQTQDSNLCTSLQGTAQYARCIGQFPQSTVWNDGCKTIMSKAVAGKGPAEDLLKGRCLTKGNANLTLPQQAKGYGSCGDWEYHEAGYERRCEELAKTGDPDNPHSPVWFTYSGILSERDIAYLESIGANPNNVDAFGRTILVIFIRNMIQLDRGVDLLPNRHLSSILEKELEPLRRLMQFGVDPHLEDATERDALESAQDIRNEAFRTRILEIMGQR